MNTTTSTSLAGPQCASATTSHAKRRKLSEASSCTSSEIIATCSTLSPSRVHEQVKPPIETPASSVCDEDDEDDGESSVVSTSSEETSSGSEDAESSEDELEDGKEITTVRARRKKPVMRLEEAHGGIVDEKDGDDDAYPPPDPETLLARLRTFIPELAKANEELEKDRLAGKLGDRQVEIGLAEAVDEDKEEDIESEPQPEGKEYIEMNLGLGVLEQKKDDNCASKDDRCNEDKDMGELDVLGKLMGQNKSEKADIRVISD